MTPRDVLRPYFLNPIRMGRILAYLPQFVRLFYRLFTDSRVSRLVKLVPFLGLILAISPPNLELDFIPVFGELDFLLIIFLTLKLFVWLCPPDVVREHVAQIGRRR
jgi:hypothetical protein